MPPKERSTLTPEQQELQNKLAAARRAAGVSQEDLAEKVGVSRQTLASVEKGRVAATNSVIAGIVVALVALGAAVIVMDLLKIKGIDDLAKRLFGNNSKVKGG
jgi:transcriptional regulator with XRE-family HTH domain